MTSEESEIIKICQNVILKRQEIDFDDDIYRHVLSDAELSELNGQCRLARKILNILKNNEV